jgi:hypothetical protein
MEGPPVAAKMQDSQHRGAAKSKHFLFNQCHCYSCRKVTKVTPCMSAEAKEMI